MLESVMITTVEEEEEEDVIEVLPQARAWVPGMINGI